MTETIALRIRRSLHELQNDYLAGNKKPLEDLMRAWKGIKDLPPDHPRSFFVIGGYHGEPFRGAGWGSSSYWGGYCHHGNVLFPTWHRIYLLKLEEALQSIEGCSDVMLPYWDETSDESIKTGIPWVLTKKEFVLGGETIPNPLRSFVLPRNIVDHLSPVPDADYGKPKGYETVRYPLSGLVGPADKQKTDEHNAQFPDYDLNVKILNENVIAWLTSEITVDGKVIPTNVRKSYEDCLNAPNYTVFSNTTSSTEWNDNARQRVRSLESPHNSIHLAVGGFDIPNQFDVSPISDANGDMGENDTAGLDPIFYFHHCFVDRVFWLWQKQHGFIDNLEIITGYPGTNSVDSQGPTPGMAPNSWLTLDSPLDPFINDTDGGRTYASRDCINIEKQLGYTYAAGSLEGGHNFVAIEAPPDERAVRVSGINRNRIPGSFLISAYADVDGKRQLLGTEAVLSRWHVEGCANCQSHLEAKAFIGLGGFTEETLGPGQIEVEVRTRNGLLGTSVQPSFSGSIGQQQAAFVVEII
ncbi:tyrosinase family protein [Rhizobium leguminosarum]|uniref:tyrosinase family protein n=1 Tax=Rhizobium leguminosarum TaxID=384 RepID=UPI001C94F305|nr:tyrosinase family protein [Rhizobium leguminosarum]MBY5408459.1 tyrosinase family protein [Rhizobium leguminosarum]